MAILEAWKIDAAPSLAAFAAFKTELALACAPGFMVVGISSTGTVTCEDIHEHVGDAVSDGITSYNATVSTELGNIMTQLRTSAALTNTATANVQADVRSLTGDIATLTDAVGFNTGDIAALTDDVNLNTRNVNTATANVRRLTGNIATLTNAVGLNTRNVATLTANLSTVVATMPCNPQKFVATTFQFRNVLRVQGKHNRAQLTGNRRQYGVVSCAHHCNDIFDGRLGLWGRDGSTVRASGCRKGGGAGV